MNLNNTLKGQNLKFNFNGKYQDNEKNSNKNISNTIENGNNVYHCMNNKSNCFNNIIKNQQVYLLNKNTIMNSKMNSSCNNFNNHNSIFVNIMNKDNNKFTFCNYNTNLTKDYNNYNYNVLNVNNFNCQINNNNILFLNKNGNKSNSFQCKDNTISNNFNIFNNLVTNDLNINYINIIQKNQEPDPFQYANISSIPQQEKKTSFENFITFIKNMQVPLVDYVCNSKGALELQKILEKSGLEVKMYFIELLKRDGLTKIMKNVHGNYFFQKLIKEAPEKIISNIIFYILEDFINISKDDSGTFSVQALLNEVSSINSINKILQRIKGNELEMIYDKNATYVVQKMVLKFPDFYRKELNDLILQNFPKLCLDVNGICLIKNFIRTNTIESELEKMKMIITNNFLLLAQSPYGNYAIQFLMEKLPKNELNEIFGVLTDNIFKLSVQQYSSNVVEKSFEKMNDFQKLKIFDKLFFLGKFIFILKNKFGKFVIRKAVNYMSNELKKKVEFELINNINKDIYNHKDKNRVKKFLYKIQGDNNSVNHNNNFNFCLDINSKDEKSF